ncbi:GtrA family protein [Paraburkholderia sp. EG286B]|uniref:GtrA family protein n=1 Tax=Paraburkholderia sp. EG286B TaxID=3237011 RepID=UPI0034D310E8
MTLAILYAIFACISAASNVATQAVVVRIIHGAHAIPASVAVGTVVGLVVKYLLDKRWIFRWKPQNARHDAGTFILYASTGVLTTAIFWGCEYLFEHRFHSEGMRYLGAVIGLSIGYVIKYQMDRLFVFPGERKSTHTRVLGSVVTVALVLFGLVKMFLIVESPQLVAISNNYDFLRVESCMGLWQDYGDGTAKMDPHLSAPVNRLILDRDVKMDLCVVSIDDIYPYLATRFRKTGAIVDFRIIGSLKIASVLAALATLLTLCRGTRSRLVVSAIFFAMFGDFVYLLYFNSMYNEFSEFLGAFICAASLWMIWTGDTKSIKASSIVMMIGVIFLGLSKQQYSGLGTLFAFVGALTLFLRFKERRLSASVLAIGLACPIVFAMTNPSDYGLPHAIKLANITDTYLGEVLPHATDKNEALKTLRLPLSCEKGIGDNWYTPGLPANHPCPSLIDASRIRLIPLFLKQPKTFFAPMSDALDKAHPVPERAYGLFAYGGTIDSPRYVITKATSFTTYMNAVPTPAFKLISIASMVCGIVMAFSCFASLLTNRRDPGNVNILLAMGGVMVLYAIGSSIFGDGTSDMTRHTIMWPFGMSLQIIAVCLMVARLTQTLAHRNEVVQTQPECSASLRREVTDGLTKQPQN